MWTFPLLLASCKVVDAPESIEDLVVYGFLNFDGSDEERTAYADGAAEQRETEREGLIEGLRVSSLTPELLVDAGISNDLEANEVIGVVATVTFASSFDEVVRVVTGDMSAVISSTNRFDITTDEDRECFLARECDSYSHEAFREVSGFWGSGTQQVSMRFRWAERSDGTEVMLFRSTAPDRMDTNSTIFRVLQHYQLYDLVNSPDGPHKFETNWVEIEVGGLDIPDRLGVDQAVNAMGQQVDDVDAFIAGGESN